MGIKAGLPWNYDIDHGVVFSQRILWILLFSASAKDLLDNGMAQQGKY